MWEISYSWYMPKMSLKQIVERRLDQLGLGPVEAAVAGNIERTYIRDILENRKRGIRADKVADLARALRLDADALGRGELVAIDSAFTAPVAPATRVPLLATVSAGEMMRDDVTDEALGYLDVADLSSGDWIALEVDGTSMDRISPPGSTIIVDRQDRRLVPNACYVIADSDGRASYKRYRPDPDRFEPVSTFDHPTIFPDHTPRIVGRVRLSILKM